MPVRSMASGHYAARRRRCAWPFRRPVPSTASSVEPSIWTRAATLPLWWTYFSTRPLVVLVAGEAGDADVFLDGAADEFLDDLARRCGRDAVGVVQGKEVGGGVDGVFEGEVERGRPAALRKPSLRATKSVWQPRRTRTPSLPSVEMRAGDEAFLHFVGKLFVGRGGSAFAEEFGGLVGDRRLRVHEGAFGIHHGRVGACRSSLTIFAVISAMAVSRWLGVVKLSPRWAIQSRVSVRGAGVEGVKGGG